MEELKNWKAKVSYAPCGWCEKYNEGRFMVKTIMLCTCLDTGATKVETEWRDNEKSFKREIAKHTASHGLCPVCFEKEMTALKEYNRIGEK